MANIVDQANGTHLQDGRWMWAPDYSNVIDVQSFPDARWYQGEPGGSDSVEIKAGFYRPAKRRERDDQATGLVSFWPDQSGAQAFMPVSQWQRQDMTDNGQMMVAEGPDYQKLKELGLWNLSDPNSPTWQFLNSQAGGVDVRNDPSALFTALNKVNTSLVDTGLTYSDGRWLDRAPQIRQKYESSLREMLQGVDAQFVDRFVPAASGAHEQYSNSIDDSVSFRDVARDFARLITEVPPLAIAAAAITGGASMAAGGTALGTGALVGAQTGALQGLSQEGDLMDGLRGAAGGAVTGGVLGAGSEYLSGGGSSLADLGAGGGTSGISPSDLAALIESGTVGEAGAALEGLAGIGGIGAASGVMSAADLAQLIESGTVGEAGAQLEGLAGIGSAAPAAAAGTTLADLASGGATAPAAPLMPPAVPPADPTFGGALTQTGAGQFENLANTGAFGAGLGATAANVGADVGPPASTPPANTPQTPSSSGGALGRILGGTATTQDWLSVLGNVGATGLSMFGLNQQQDSLNNIAQQQMAAEQARYNDLVAREQERFGTLLGREDAAIGRQRADIEFGRAQGAPYREQLAGLFADPNSFLQSAAVQAPVQQGTDALARALSVKGNPAGNPAAMAEIQQYASNNLASLLGREKDRLAQFGGLTQFAGSGATVPGIGSSLPGSATAGSGVGTSGGLSALLGGAQAGAQRWENLGTGLRDIFSLV
jgi:hypothetical protein